MSSPGIITYPLGGITYDAEDAAAYFAGRTSGVYSTDIDFAVAAAADGNTDLTVSAGQAWMHVSRWVGLSVTMREAQTLTLPLADSALPRIDRVVLRYDATSRSTSLQVLQGAPSSEPAGPDLSRTEMVYDLCLAEVSRPAGQTSVSTADLTDTRTDEALCGLMRDGVTGIPMDELGQQALAKAKETAKLCDKLLASYTGGYLGIWPVTLTADGWALMPYIQEICRQQRSIEERAKDLRGLETGVVRVAVFTSVSVQWMPYILKSFREQYPNIEFELLPSNYNTEIARWIQDGTADCGFLVLPTEPNLDCWLLQRDQWKAIVPWDHPLAGREPFPPEALAQYPFILLEEGDDYEIQEVLDTLGVQPNVQYRVQQDQVILAMVSCGLGISIMEELMLEQNEYPVVACSFAKPFYRNIGICVKDKRAISRSTYRFVEHVRRWVLEKYSG